MYPDIDTTQRLTALALEAGPFFFAILILVYLARRAGIDYREVYQREKPRRASHEEIAARRRIYYANWAVGFLLVILAAGWWLYKKSVPEGPVVFQFAISGLSDQDQFKTLDDNTFTRTVTNFSAGDSAAPKTTYFALMSPFAEEKVIYIQYTYLDIANAFSGIIEVGPDANGQRLLIEREHGRIKTIAEGDNRVSLKRIGRIAADVLRSPGEGVFQLTRMDSPRSGQPHANVGAIGEARAADADLR
jgi:hypothetical protein